MNKAWQILMCLLATGAAGPNAPLVYKPTADWIFFDLDNSCIVQRQFTSDRGGSAFLRLERFTLPPALQMWIAGPEIHLYPKAKLVDVQFGSLAPTYKAPIAATTDGVANELLWIGGEWPTSKTAAEDAPLNVKRAAENLIISPDDENGSATAIDSLSVRRGLKQDARFELGSMTRPMNTLHHCIERHLASWGLNVEAHRTLTRRAAPEDEDALFTSIYQEGEHGLTRHGMVRLRVMVAPTGTATSCVVLQQKGDAGLGTATCKAILARATFHPALDHAGDPIASVWFDQVSFN